jgi:hypothetical protein
MKTEKIFVQLLNEGTTVFRPVMAEKIHGNIYKILSDQEHNPEIEVWQYLPGQTVEVEEKSGSSRDVNQKIKIAVKPII